MSLVQVNKLSRRYGHHTAVDSISFELNKGDILGFLGPNGAGKSTSMKMLCGVLAPSEGEILIDGHDLLDAPAAAKRSLGYLPEQPPVYRDMTVDEYLGFCARLHGIGKTDIDAARCDARARCGLDDVAGRLIGNLSKGYQQRVGIAQAIIHRPAVIVLDEPTVGLDPIQIREIRELIAELGQDHGIILSTHILPEVQAVCNRVQIIDHGKLVFESSMAALGQNERFHATFSGAVDSAHLTDLACVAEVSEDDDGFVLLLSDTPDTFISDCVGRGLKLMTLTPYRSNLEQIFIGLTLQESGGDTAIEASAA